MKRGVFLFLAAMLFTIGLATTTTAQSSIGLHAIGAKIGFVDPEDIKSTIGFGAEADLGKLTPELNLGAFINFWRKSEGSGGYEVSFTELTFGATVKYFIEAGNSPFKPFVGGGAGFAYGKSSVETPTVDFGYGTIGGSSSESNLDFAIVLMGGAEYALSETLTGFGQILYKIDGVNYLGLFIGVMFPLGK